MSNKELREKQKAKREAQRLEKEAANKKSYEAKKAKLRKEIDELIHNKK